MCITPFWGRYPPFEQFKTAAYSLYLQGRTQDMELKSL